MAAMRERMTSHKTQLKNGRKRRATARLFIAPSCCDDKTESAAKTNWWDACDPGKQTESNRRVASHRRFRNTWTCLRDVDDETGVYASTLSRIEKGNR